MLMALKIFGTPHKINRVIQTFVLYGKYITESNIPDMFFFSSWCETRDSIISLQLTSSVNVFLAWSLLSNYSEKLGLSDELFTGRQDGFTGDTT